MGRWPSHSSSRGRRMLDLPGELILSISWEPLLTILSGAPGLGKTLAVRRALATRPSSRYATFVELLDECLEDLRRGKKEPLTSLSEPDLFALDDLPFHDEPLDRVATWKILDRALIRFRIRPGKPSLLVADPTLPMIQPLIRAARWSRGPRGVRIQRIEPPPRHARERWLRAEAARLGVRPTRGEVRQIVAIHPWNFPAARGALLRLKLERSP